MDANQSHLLRYTCLALLIYCSAAAAEVITAAETTDRLAMIDTDSIYKIPSKTEAEGRLEEISFIVVEFFNNKQKDGAEVVTSRMYTQCSTRRSLLVVANNRFSSKDDQKSSITKGMVSIENPQPIDIQPISAERLITDSACWAAYGKPKGLPRPDFGSPPKDSVRLACETKYSEDTQPISLEFDFHEATSRVFLRKKLAVSASITKDQISLPLFANQEVLRYVIRRTTGQATIFSSTGNAHGSCRRLENNQF